MNIPIFAKIKYPLCLLLLIVIHFYIQLQDIPRFFYNADELMHLQMSKADSFKKMLAYSTYETHPPVVNSIRYFWLKIDDSIESVRLISITFMALTSIVLFLCGKLQAGNSVGLLAAFFTLFSYFGISLSFAVRNYAAYGCFLALTYYFYLRLRKERTRYWLNLCGYFASGLLAILSNFSAIILLFSMTVVYFCTLWREESLGKKIMWLGVNTLLAVTLFIALRYTTSWTQAVYQTEFYKLDRAYTLEPVIRFVYLVQMQLMAQIFSVQPFILPGLFSYLLLLPLWAFLYLMIRQNKTEAYILLVTMLFTLLLYYTGKFPYTMLRHLYFMFIPMVLLTSNWLVAFLEKTLSPKYRELVFWGTLLVLASFCLVDNKENGFLKGEKPVTSKTAADLAMALKKLNDTDLIVVPKQTIFHIFGDTDTVYRFLPDTLVNKYLLIQKDNLSIAFDPALSQFHSGKYLLKSLKQINQDYDLSHKTTIYFLQVMWQDIILADLLKCKGLQPYITIAMSDTPAPFAKQGMVLFKLPKRIVFDDLGTGKNLIEQCLSATDTLDKKYFPDFQGL